MHAVKMETEFAQQKMGELAFGELHAMARRALERGAIDRRVYDLVVFDINQATGAGDLCDAAKVLVDAASRLAVLAALVQGEEAAMLSEASSRAIWSLCIWHGANDARSVNTSGLWR